MLVKTFTLGGRRVETRLLTKQIGQWVGYSYRWDVLGQDATLVPAAGADQEFMVADPAVRDGDRKQTWHYPSRTECMVCHSRAANFVLGLSTDQMNKVHDYPGGRAGQLRTLEHLGVFHVGFREHLDQARAGEQTGGGAGAPAAALELAQPDPVPDGEKTDKRPLFTTLLPRVPESYRRLVDPYDERAPLEARRAAICTPTAPSAMSRPVAATPRSTWGSRHRGRR